MSHRTPSGHPAPIASEAVHTHGGARSEVRRALFRDYLEADRFMLIVTFAHWVLAAGAVSWAHGFFLAGFLGGGVIFAIAAVGYALLRGTVYSRVAFGVCLMLFSALYIQQGLGRIEWHFHVFCALAFLVRYKDLRPLLAAVVTITVHHVLFDWCQAQGVDVLGVPLAVFDYGSGLDIVALHAAFVVLEALALGYIIVDLTRQFCDRARASQENADVLAALDRVISHGDLSVRVRDDYEQARVVNELLAIMKSHYAVRAAFEDADAPIVITDRDGCITDCNRAATSLFESVADDFASLGRQVDPQGLVGSSAELLLPEAARRALRAEETVRTTIEPGDRLLSVVCSPVVNAEGDRLGGILEWRDETSERRMERELQAMVTAASGGDLDRRIDLGAVDGFHAGLGRDVNDLVAVADRLIADCSGVLAAVAEGDLTRRVQAPYGGQFGRLTEDLNGTIRRLTEIVERIQGSAVEVERGAREIAEGNGHLADRMRSQAAALQQTSSSMEQLTSTVRANADHAVEASRLAADAHRHALHGGDVVGRAIKAMEAIQGASSKVTDITSVIDEIAFQTNLLAVNAAVEAARAGEHGRGFAVVASEVRSLAARSATAAREINDLIAHSVERIEQGSALVDESGRSLASIVQSVELANAVVDQIASAIGEQSEGIEVVNVALSEMDDITQQNAAMIEQSASASRSMGAQARALSELACAFETAKGEEAPSLSVVGAEG